MGVVYKSRRTRERSRDERRIASPIYSNQAKYREWMGGTDDENDRPRGAQGDDMQEKKRLISREVNIDMMKDA
jgi:hypothetical protein